MLSSVLLHVIPPAGGINLATDSAPGPDLLRWCFQIMDDVAVFRVGYFGHNELFVTGRNDSPVVYLAAAGGIERSAVQHYPRFWAFADLLHFGIEVVEERVVVIQALCHAQNHISPQRTLRAQGQNQWK